MKNKLEYVSNFLFSKEMGILPACLAFSFFLAIIPILTLIVYVFTSFNLPIDIMQNFLNNTFPSGVVELLQPIFSDTLTSSSIITLVFAICVATNGSNAIILASNTIFNVSDSSILRRTIKAVIITIIMILLFSFIIVVPLLGSSILTLIGSFSNIVVENESVFNMIYIILQIPVSLLIIFIFIKMIYTIAPDENIPSKYTNKGAVFTTLMWLLLTTIFSYYINNIAKYDLIYGNLTNIVILLIWFYGLAYIFVLGLYMNKSNVNKGIEQTNTIKLEEIRNKVKGKTNKTN